MIPIIIVPWSPTTVRYWPAGKRWYLGLRSSKRISIALSPPMKKKSPMPQRYWSPTTLWSVAMPR